MKMITVFRTQDGQIHNSQFDARKHAEKRYGDALLKIARDITGLKYTETAAYLNDNLDKLVELKELQQDTRLENDPDDEL